MRKYMQGARIGAAAGNESADARDVAAGFVSVEWIGLMFVVVAVLGVLIANGESIGGSIQGAIEGAIDSISGGG